MKKLRGLSLTLVIALMGLLIMFNTNDVSQNLDATDNDKVIISLINGNKDAGDSNLYLILGEEGTVEILENYKLFETSKSTYVCTPVENNYQANIGDRLIFAYENYDEEYVDFIWSTYNNGYLTPTLIGDEYYIKDYFVFTAKKETTMCILPKKATDHIVTYYDSGMKNIIGLGIANDNDKVYAKYVEVPHIKGFRFDKWSEELTNITENISVYVLYGSSIISVFVDFWPFFLKGLGVTLLLSIISVFLALFSGCGICLLRMSKPKALKILATSYVEIIRGVPLLLQLLLIYCILGPTRISFGSFFTTEVLACILTLFINSSAYVSEIFRAGIQAVDKGQMEAGRALGLSKWQVMRKIILPQGIKNSLPSIGNELIMIIKETSLAVSVDVSIGELMCVRKSITGATFINLPPYIIVAIIYFIVTFSLSKVVGYIEKRLDARD